MNASEYPIVVMWNFGYQCNMNCIHCYSRVGLQDTMTTERAEYIAKEIIRAKALHVHFGGGESLMRKDFGHVASSLARSGVNVSLSSNGSFIDEEMAQVLLGIPLDSVSLSFHGVTAATHDVFTRYPGAFEALCRASKNLVHVGVRTKIVYSLNAHTKLGATGILGLARDMGVTDVHFAPIKLVGNAAENLQLLQLMPDEWRALYKDISVEAESYPGLSIHYGFENNPVIAEYLGKTILPCPCGRYSVAIRPNGDVSPCNVVTAVLGNVFQRPLLDIWQKAPELQAIRNSTASPCASLQK